METKETNEGVIPKTFLLPAELADRLKEFCESTTRSQIGVVIEALDRFLKKEKS